MTLTAAAPPARAVPRPAYRPPWVTPPDRAPTLQEMGRLPPNRLLFLPRQAYEAPIVSGSTAGRRWHMVVHPDGMKQVLLDEVDQFPKSPIMRHLLRPARHGIFHVDGQRWRVQRGAVAETFKPRTLDRAAPEMAAAARVMAERLDTKGPVADLYPEMVLATFDIICRLIAARPDAFDVQGFSQAVEGYMEIAGRPSPLDFVPWPLWLPKPGHLLARPFAVFARRAVQREIDAFHAGVASSLFVERLSSAVDAETGRPLTPLQIRDNILTFVLAGHETSAISLAWALLMLAHDPVRQEEARDEALAVVGAGGEQLEKAAGQVPLCRRIFDEAMRLYPPIAVVSRVAQEHGEILGSAIKKGDAVVLPFAALHRHEALWDDPHRFRPDRFETKPERFRYLPFGGGPRICVGAAMAYMEADILIAALLTRFRFKPTEQLPVPFVTMTLRPRGGVPLIIERLAGGACG